MERVAVGIDGSPASLDALRWAGQLAHIAHLEVIAVRAWVPDQIEVQPEAVDKLNAEAHGELDDWCTTAGSPVLARTVVAAGDPPGALLTAAEEQHADLLVVGTRGAGGFARLHLGSVAHHLAHHTTVPLAIVPRSAAGTVVRHIVVGTDGSPGSLVAVRFCAELASTLLVPVTAVLANEPFLEWVPASNPRSWYRHAQRQVRQWAEPLAATGAPVEVVVDRDIHPVAALARALEARPGSIAVVGTRGLGGFAGLRLGRVPIQLVHNTGAAVILVPAPAT